MSESSETESQAPQGDLPENGQEALSVLKNLWQAQGQGNHSVEQSCESNSGPSNNAGCKNTKHMGFDGIINEVAANSDGDEDVDDVQTAWRKKLQQEGKLAQEGKSVRDMVLGDAEGSR